MLSFSQINKACKAGNQSIGTKNKQDTLSLLCRGNQGKERKKEPKKERKNPSLLCITRKKRKNQRKERKKQRKKYRYVYKKDFFINEIGLV